MSNDPFDGSDLMSAIPTGTSGTESGSGSGENDMDLDSNADKSANDGIGSAKTTGKDVASSDTTKKGVGAVETAGTDITGVSIKGSKDSQPVSIKGPDYSTSFCRPRPTESPMGKKVSSWILKVNGYLDIGGVSWGPHLAVFTTFGTCAIIALLLFYWKEPELFKNLMGGYARMLWYGLIFLMIITMLVLFSHYLYWVAYFFELTVHFFNLTKNPLLDQTVASLCCLFSDYINWIIYYPSMIFFLFVFLCILFVDIFLLLPIFIFFGCIIGSLFSMFGKGKPPKVMIEEIKKLATDHINTSNVVKHGIDNVINMKKNLKNLNLFRSGGSESINTLTKVAGELAPAFAPGPPGAVLATRVPAVLAASAS